MNLNLIKLGQTVAFLKYLASIDPLGATRNSICSQKNVMTFRGRGLRAKQFQSLLVQSMKKTKIFLRIDLTFSFTKAMKQVLIHYLLFVVQSSIQLQQKETGTANYLHFQESTCLTFLSWHTQLNLITMDGRCFRTDIKDQ